MGARTEKKGCRWPVMGCGMVVFAKGLREARSRSSVERKPERARRPSKAKASRDGTEACGGADEDAWCKGRWSLVAVTVVVAAIT